MGSAEDGERASPRAVALSTLWYSLLLAAVMQAAHVSVRVALAAVLGVPALPGASALGMAVALAAELAQKITWVTLICESLVLARILARGRPLLLVIGAGLVTVVAVWAGDVLGALIILPHPLTNLGTLDVGAALDDAVFRGGKYLCLGAALAWANRPPESLLSRYALAGGVASLVAIVLTLSVRAGDGVVSLSSQVLIEILFPLGCALVVLKGRRMAAPLIRTQQSLRAQLQRM